ncbi:MAG: DUF58 domain-containing protein [Synechococcales cyanobacterium RM1_1_8]|nr:DUF58 domain-containing protein [Synechococcales cyanobacterium RM1_1_8]
MVRPQVNRPSSNHPNPNQPDPGQPGLNRSAWRSLRYLPDQRDRFTAWLETRWVNPSYGGWVLLGLCLFFFAAASNTMAGWLYVMSGVGLALLAVAAWLSRRGLNGLSLSRVSSPPVTVGQALTLELVVSNGDRQAKSLLQIIDPLPQALGGPQIHPIRLIAPHGSYRWRYYQPAQARGLYRWDEVQLRTEAPLGLCGHRRCLPIQAKAVVYPTILPLGRCPLVDHLGEERQSQQTERSRHQAANDGLTRSLRPYRWGDPMRMVHWRTSARFGELRVRELENVQSGQAVVLAIDSGGVWPSSPGLPRLGADPAADPAGDAAASPAAIADQAFETAVVAMASLYRYASRRHSNVQIWTATHGLVQGETTVLETLAAVQITPGQIASGQTAVKSQIERPRSPHIWLTANAASLATLPPGSTWILWPNPATPGPIPTQAPPGIKLNPALP